MTDSLEKNMQLEIHQRALGIVERYKRVEAELLDILQQADEYRVYYLFECKNLHEYAMNILKLSESVAFNFITVARKAKEVPELKVIIESGALSVSKARKITPVLTFDNQKEWLQMAVELPQRKLEHYVAKACPKEAVTERMKFVSEDRLNLQLGISESLSRKLKRAQDLESQKKRKSVSLEETLDVLLDLYLKEQDPVQKSERLKNRKNLSVARQVTIRDQGQCTFTYKNGDRCLDQRWIDTHHIIPKNLGGSNTLENLATLCSGHHKLMHAH